MLGKIVEFEVISDAGTILKRAKINKIEFHPLLKKPIFTAVTPQKNEVKLTREEIKRVV
jgi:hypothetical protein